MGNAYFNIKEYNKAIEVYKKVIQHELTFNDSKAYTCIGDQYLKMNQIKEAIENYQKAIEIKPHNRIALEKLKQLKRE